MKPDRFKELLDELDGNSLQTLKEKNPKYAKKGDCLYNFKVGAELMNCTTAQACWNYMSKHLAELWGKIETNDFSNREDFLEKCQDTINYIRFLWCIGNECVDKNISIEDELEHYKFGIYGHRCETPSEAETFITKMNVCRQTHGGKISVVDVRKFFNESFEQEDYHIGWHSTDDWMIMPINDACFVQMPRPVNI